MNKKVILWSHVSAFSTGTQSIIMCQSTVHHLADPFKKERKKRCTRKPCMLTEGKQADARGSEEYSEEQLIPIKRLDLTMLPRSLSSWIISCMCWLQGTALTCNTWLPQNTLCFAFINWLSFFSLLFSLFLWIFWHFVPSPFFPTRSHWVVFCMASNPCRHFIKRPLVLTPFVLFPWKFAL